MRHNPRGVPLVRSGNMADVHTRGRRFLYVTCLLRATGQRRPQQRPHIRNNRGVPAPPPCTPLEDPSVAFCVSGLVRALTRPAVYKALRANLFDKFGGRPTLLLLLKNFDTAHKVMNHFPGDVTQDVATGRDDAALHAALAYLKPDVVNFQNSTAGDAAFVNHQCTLGGASREYNSAAGRVRHAGQIRSNLRCAEEVEAFERRSGARFDVVVHLRPDIAVLAPFSPYWSFRCLNNTIYSSKKDYIYFSARDALVAVIRRMSADYQGCVGSSWWSDRFERLLRGVSQRVAQPFRFVEPGLPIGLVRDPPCPTTGNGGCKTVGKDISGVYLVQCTIEDACHAAIRRGARLDDAYGFATPIKHLR